MLFDIEMESIKYEYSNLVEEIKKLNHHYYNLNESLISDYEYDLKYKRLLEIEKQYPELKTKDSPSNLVGAISNTKFSKVTHKYPMLSLSNTYSIDEVKEFENRIKKIIDKDLEYILELKLDGISISIIYEDGILKKAVTRGDGKIGEDVTENVMQIASIKHKLNEKVSLELRGEIILPVNEFERINSENESLGKETFANIRNIVSGTIRQLDKNIVKERNLDCYIYSLVNPDEFGLLTHEESINFIEKLGVKTTKVFEKITNMEQMEERIKYWDNKRHKLNFATDGLVIKVNDLSLYDEIGYTSKFPKWAIAYKFKTEQKETILKSVSYQIGRTGNITPVANLKEVNISGTKVKRASLYSFDEIDRLEIMINDHVIIEKAAEIIPQVVKVLKEKRTGKEIKIEKIKNCPNCNSLLFQEENQVALKCKNEKCSDRIKRKLEYFVSRDALNIQGLASKLLEKLFDLGYIKDITDIFNLKIYKDDLIKLDKMGEKSVTNLLENIEKSKNMSFNKVFYALGIEYIGKSASDLITNHFENIDNILSASIDDLLQIDGIGDKSAISVYEFFKDEDNLNLINKLKEFGLKFNLEKKEFKNNNFVTNKIFAVTGKLEKYSRDEMKEYILSFGGQFTNTISKKLDYLIIGEKAHSKLQKAQDLGIKVITEEEFFKEVLNG